MIPETIWRGRTIAKRSEVTIHRDSRPPHYFRFDVKKRDGQIIDVYYSKKKGIMQWSCNSITDKGVGSCVYFKGDQTKPYCSHTLAASILLSQIKQVVRERELGPLQCHRNSPITDSSNQNPSTHQEAIKSGNREPI